MDEKKIFEFLNSFSNLKEDKSAFKINLIIKNILAIWDDENIKFHLSSFYYGNDKFRPLCINISVPEDIKPIVDENIEEGKVPSDLLLQLKLQESFKISNFRHLMLVLSFFDSELVYSSNEKYQKFLNLNNQIVEEIDEYYKKKFENQEENTKIKGGNKNFIQLKDSRHNKFLIHNNNKYQILNKSNNGILVSDKNNNIKFIDI
jgi:hypothetical protein